MSLEDSQLKLSLEKNIRPEEERPSVAILAQPDENLTNVAVARVESEKNRLDRIEELRGELGAVASQSEEDTTLDAQRKEGVLQEDRENLSSTFRRLAENLDELSSVISRNKFPRISLDSDGIRKLGSAETINAGNISAELDVLSRSLSKISMPEDSRDRMELAPRNFRAIIDVMEELLSRLSALRKTLEETKSQDLQDPAQAITKIRTKILAKVESFDGALILLRRIRDGR